MERIVFLDRDSIQARIRAPAFAHAWQDHPATAPTQVVERLHEASIAITNKVRLDAAALAQLPALRLIAVCATGTDNVDLAYCRAHAIAVANIRNYAVHAVPEHVFMMILALRRNLIAYRADLRAGRWQQADQFCLFTQPIHDLHGSTLGVIGHGALGQAVAKLAAVFGMRVLIAEHKGASTARAGYAAFDTVLREADVLTLHAPLTPATRHLIGEQELRHMKPEALLINAGRGGLVDEHALARALQAGIIAGAGIDVLSSEPPRQGNPLLDLDLPNLIVTPHVAWASGEAMQIMADQLVDNIEAFVAGRRQNRVV
jgi:glycerate dehydrogenase